MVSVNGVSRAFALRNIPEEETPPPCAGRSTSRRAASHSTTAPRRAARSGTDPTALTRRKRHASRRACAAASGKLACTTVGAHLSPTDLAFSSSSLQFALLFSHRTDGRVRTLTAAIVSKCGLDALPHVRQAGADDPLCADGRGGAFCCASNRIYLCSQTAWVSCGKPDFLVVLQCL